MTSPYPCASSLLIPLRCTHKLPAPHSKSSPLLHSALLHSIPRHTCFSQRSNPTQEKRCSSFALGIASCQATTAHFLKVFVFYWSKNKLCCLTVSAETPSLSCCLQLGCHPHGSLLCLLLPLLCSPLSLRSAQPQRIHRLPVFLLACGSLRAAGCHAFCTNAWYPTTQAIAYTFPTLKAKNHASPCVVPFHSGLLSKVKIQKPCIPLHT